MRVAVPPRVKSDDGVRTCRIGNPDPIRPNRIDGWMDGWSVRVCTNTRQDENNNRSKAFSPSPPRRNSWDTGVTRQFGTWGGGGDGSGAADSPDKYKTSRALQRGEAGFLFPLEKQPTVNKAATYECTQIRDDLPKMTRTTYVRCSSAA